MTVFHQRFSIKTAVLGLHRNIDGNDGIIISAIMLMQLVYVNIGDMCGKYLLNLMNTILNEWLHNIV